MTETYKKWVSGIFDRSSSTYGQGSANYFSYFAKHLVDTVEIPAGSSVLDVATGRGAILKRIVQAAGVPSKIVGVDLSPGMIQRTSKKIKAKKGVDLEFAVMDAEQLKFADETFDFIFCGFAVFFFPNLPQAMQEFFRVMKGRGKLLISTFDKRTPLQQTLSDELTRMGQGESVAVRPSDVKEAVLKVAKETGFQKIQVTEDVLDHVYPTFNDWIRSQWTHARRGNLEKLNRSQYRQLKENLAKAVAPHLRSDGLHDVMQVLYIHSEKSSR